MNLLQRCKDFPLNLFMFEKPMICKKVIDSGSVHWIFKSFCSWIWLAIKVKRPKLRSAERASLASQSLTKGSSGFELSLLSRKEGPFERHQLDSLTLDVVLSKTSIFIQVTMLYLSEVLQIVTRSGYKLGR